MNEQKKTVRMWKRWFFLSIVVILSYPVTMLGLVIYGAQIDIKQSPKLDYVLILGARVTTYGPMATLQFRLDTALAYVQEHDLKIPIIVSGGQGDDEPMSEAQSMHDYLVARGIPSAQIIQENQSTNTKENILFSKRKMDQGTHILLVTNDFHMGRSTYLAQRAGLIVSRYPAPNTSQKWLANVMREPLAFVKTLLFDHI